MQIIDIDLKCVLMLSILYLARKRCCRLVW